MSAVRRFAAIGVVTLLVACASPPDVLLTYAAQGVVIQAERLVSSLLDETAERLPYGGPAIEAPLRRMQARFPALRAALEAGTIGLTEDGDVAIPDPARSTPELRELVRMENRDRAFFYAGMAEAVGHQTFFVSYVDATFGAEWQKRAPSGWWLRDEHGRWQTKH